MKKILALLFSLFLICSNCLAIDYKEYTASQLLTSSVLSKTTNFDRTLKINYVIVTLSASTDVDINIILDSHVGTNYDSRIYRYDEGSWQYLVLNLNGLILANGDQIKLTTDATHAGITAYIVIVGEGV